MRQPANANMFLTEDPGEIYFVNEHKMYLSQKPGRLEKSMNPVRSQILPVAALLCALILFIPVVSAFTANSLDITVDKNGDAVASFRFTLEGVIENAIPQSMLEDQLKKGLSTSSEPPVLISDDRSSATIEMKQFADTSDVPTGTEYRTASMDFSKAEIALQNSALSYVIKADFSPASITVTFPDGYKREFSNIGSLPSITHTVIDPSKANRSAAATTGSIKVTTSPASADITIDNVFAGNSPGTFTDLAPGTHTVLAQKEGFMPMSRTVNVTAGLVTPLALALPYGTPVPTTARPSPGFGLPVAVLALAGCAGVIGIRRRI